MKSLAKVSIAVRLDVVSGSSAALNFLTGGGGTVASAVAEGFAAVCEPAAAIAAAAGVELSITAADMIAVAR